MGTKKNKRKTCTYCVVPKSSITGDHVIAREFFPLGKRDNLPQVPTCETCNKTKSDLEHYLTAVLPFGYAHTDAHKYMKEKVAPRLVKNQWLARELSAGMKSKYVSQDGGQTWEIAGTLPLDSEKIVELFKFIAKGLAYYHWGILLPDRDVTVYGGFLHSIGATAMKRMLQSRTGKFTRPIVLGEGVFKYEGVQDPNHLSLTVWRMTLYGIVMDGDPSAKAIKVSDGYVITAPRGLKVATDVIEKFSGKVTAAAS